MEVDTFISPVGVPGTASGTGTARSIFQEPKPELEQDLSLETRSWQVLSQGPSGERVARFCRHTGPDLTIKTGGERHDRKTAVVAICFGRLGPFSIHDCMPEITQKQPQDRKTIFETLSLPVAKILSLVARQAPTKLETAL